MSEGNMLHRPNALWTDSGGCMLEWDLVSQLSRELETLEDMHSLGSKLMKKPIDPIRIVPYERYLTPCDA